MLQKVSVGCWVFLLAFAACKSTEKPVSQSPQPAQIQVLATIHKHHASNPNYPYQKVTQLINQLNPDIIGIEIRPEDLKEDSAYLAQFYPLEMRQVLKDFPLEQVRGLDWYGNEMRGKKLPSDVFKNENTELGKVKKLESEMNRDSLVLPKLMPLVELGQQQVEIARNSSPEILNNGQYDTLTDQFYLVLDEAVKGTGYETYTNFNKQRDEIITKNILKLVKDNPGKKIIVLVGANHRSRAVKALENMPESQVKIIPVQD